MLRKRMALILLITGSVHADMPIDTLIIRVQERREIYQIYDSFSVRVISQGTDMDRKWEPKEITRVEKKIVYRGTRHEEIMRAVRINKGEEIDVTESFREEEAKRRTEAGPDDRRRGFSVSMNGEEILPFSEKHRPLYVFGRLPDTLLNGRPVRRIEARSTVESDTLMHGTFAVDKETFDIVRAELTPSKTPGVVKEMRFVMDFRVLPGNYFVLERFWMRFYVNAIIKKVRMIIEENYADYRIPASVS
ncbi:MAG TPA: hypothetical protein ENN03_01355 [bacterium]|nr:hypothetical protein [bacterium]